MRALVVAAVLALACSKHEPPQPVESVDPLASVSQSAAPPSASSSAPPSASAVASVSAAASAASTITPAPSASAAASAAPPTEEDFEDEATKAITAKSLDSQLDELEKEIQAD